ncbi:MAG: hypothetical protein ACI89L_001715 [Phycisphaerales bacterium]
MNPTFPENRVRRLVLLVLLACAAFPGERAGVSARAVAATDTPAVFDPFTDHAGLPAGLTWLVQIERPATQIESEQGRSLAAAVAQTELMTQTSKAWSRLARTLGGEHDALGLLGDRAQFIAGSRSVGQPWAVSLEIDADHRRRLLARLKAFPRLHRDRRPISELEDGRYLLAVFDRGERAVVLLAPRSDRAVRPQDDPETALFFAMFDRLAGTIVPGGGEPNTLAAPLEAVGAGEILIARRVSSLSWNPSDQSVSIEDRDQDDGASGGSPGRGDSGFLALRLDRAAGGWAGELAVSDRDRAEDVGGVTIDYERLADAAETISWVSLTPGVRSVLPLVAARVGPLPIWLPLEGDLPGYVALLRPSPADKDSLPTIAMVQRIEAAAGPERFDGAVAAALRSAPPGKPGSGKPGSGEPGSGEPGLDNSGSGHAGRYPGAVRAQRVETASLLGPIARVGWGYSEPSGATRTAAMVIMPGQDAADRDEAGSARAELALRALLEAGGGAVHRGEADPRGEAPVSAGRLRLAELYALGEVLGLRSKGPDPLLSRIESIGWSLRSSEIGDVSAMIGPVSVTLTPSRQSGLGSK